MEKMKNPTTKEIQKIPLEGNQELLTPLVGAKKEKPPIQTQNISSKTLSYSQAHKYFPEKNVEILEEDIVSGVEESKIPLRIKAKAVEELIKEANPQNISNIAKKLSDLKTKLNPKHFT